MTREEQDFIGAMNMCDEISNEAYKKIMCHCEEQEPCEDAISRQKVLKLIKQRCNPYGKPTIDFEEGKKLLKYIDNLPPVNPQPKTGRWTEDEDEMKVWCSECGEENDRCSKCCPNCGAKMVEPRERSDKR